MLNIKNDNENLNYIGSEISSEQCKYAKERIEKINISNDG